MNKAQVIEAIQKSYGAETTKKQAADALATVLEVIAKGVKKDKAGVQLIGFGTFRVSSRKSRKGRNPKTGASMTIKASKSVRFSPSSVLRKSL